MLFFIFIWDCEKSLIMFSYRTQFGLKHYHYPKKVQTELLSSYATMDFTSSFHLRLWKKTDFDILNDSLLRAYWILKSLDSYFASTKPLFDYGIFWFHFLRFGEVVWCPYKRFKACETTWSWCCRCIGVPCFLWTIYLDGESVFLQ